MSQQRHGEKKEHIRSVERAIDVLQALNRRPLSTLQDLHSDTGLPKPSIVRLLRTLEAKGLAAQSSSYGAYQLRSGVKSLASGFHHEPLIVEIAEPIMIDFTRREGWPLSLGLFDVDAVIVRACTIRYTALSLEHSALDRRLSLIRHAMGRAYLAFGSPQERENLIAIHRRSRRCDDYAHDEEAITAMIERIRERGYALRDPRTEPRSATIGVPIYDHGRVIASLGVTWIAAAMTVKDAVERYLPILHGISRTITDKLTNQPPDLCHGPPGMRKAMSERLVLASSPGLETSNTGWNACD